MFIEEHVQNNPEEPFFLLHSMQAFDLPSFPAEQFKGKTNPGSHGYFILEMDFVVGQLLEKLEEVGVAEPPWSYLPEANASGQLYNLFADPWGNKKTV